MATTKTYTFVSGQVADATQVNKNFDDLLAGINAGVSATDKVLGRATAGAGAVEEIPCTAAGRALLDDASADAQLTTLGVTAAAKTVLDDTTVGAILATIGGMPSAAGTVTLAQMANLAQDIIIGRATASTGVPEAIACTAAGRALLDDASAAAQIATLGITATAAELNVLDGITSTVTELNYVDGVTSAIQTQLDSKVSGVVSYAASDTLLNSFDAAASVSATSYTKYKSIKVPVAGTYRTKFDLISDNASITIKGKIYVNGVARGSELSALNQTVTCSGGDFLVGAGDTLELWAYVNAGSASVANFRLYGTASATPVFIQV
jgi:hypothetical protein